MTFANCWRTLILRWAGNCRSARMPPTARSHGPILWFDHCVCKAMLTPLNRTKWTSLFWRTFSAGGARPSCFGTIGCAGCFQSCLKYSSTPYSVRATLHIICTMRRRSAAKLCRMLVGSLDSRRLALQRDRSVCRYVSFLSYRALMFSTRRHEDVRVLGNEALFMAWHSPNPHVHGQSQASRSAVHAVQLDKV
jgi:hypothetical protein